MSNQSSLVVQVYSDRHNIEKAEMKGSKGHEEGLLNIKNNQISNKNFKIVIKANNY